ncbi:mechanosensitive ion channel family protein [Psychrobacter urativorans]|uniref:Small-conductance mechanosensitive channel n=1 Tax=Psychrobacter urativorans TaxID=45610 RepID=A0A0M4TV76_9GAMM|nr:mechanosensitive ion channel family protein [Psychrobacter urativorans]ALF59674.1 mechanosensitive ion channel protein MscS [Psychrobacter urativorans]
MTADFDHLLKSRFLLIWGQTLLLLSIICTFPAYATGENKSDTANVLDAENTEISRPNSSVTSTPSTNSTTATTTEVSTDARTEPSKPNDATTIPILPTIPIPDSAIPPVINSEHTNNAQIETTPTPLKDNDIRQRISGIFSEIEGLHAINVSVNQGVVTLTGETPNEKKAQQAINLTNRLTDVVTVEDRINRTLDVQDNVNSVYQGLKNQGKTIVKASPLLLVGIVVFAMVTWFGNWLSKRQKMWQRLTPNPFVAELLSQTVKVVFIIVGMILALSFIGAETILGTLLGGAGVIGIAVGFAVKDTIENYIASLMLSIRQPFRARDHIVINGKEGIVVRLTSRATILMTLDGNQLRIPNAEVFKSTILNYTKNPERRFTFELGVDNNDDPLAAIKVGIDVIRTLDFVLDKPKAIATIKAVGDSNIILEFKVWVNQLDTDFSKARSIAIREAKHALENAGFSLPEPIYRLRFNHKLEKALANLQYNDAVNKTMSDLMMTANTSISENASHINKITLDDKDKKQAKARAKIILQGESAEDVLNSRPDGKLMEKVEQEIAESSNEPDLLDKNSPQE